MATTNLAYRLRIRDALNTTDAYVWSSVPTDPAPYVEGPPDGDGQELDPLTGAVTVGSYRIRVVDALIGTNTRLVTSALADLTGQQQLLTRQAFIEYSTDGGASWIGIIGGYVNSVQMVSALVYEIAVGDTNRVEMNTTVFQQGTPIFNALGCMVGGPVQNGWGPLIDHGPVEFVAGVVAAGADGPGYVKLTWVKGPVGPDYNVIDFSNSPASGSALLPNNSVKWINTTAKPYFVPSTEWYGYNITGTFPRVLAAVYDANMNLLGFFPLLSGPQPASVALPTLPPGTDAWSPAINNYYDTNRYAISGNGTMYLDWETGGSVPQPSNGATLYAYIYLSVIDANHPIHWMGHPVDFATALWTDNLIAYDPITAANVRAALGPGLRISCRITDSDQLTDILQQYLYGPFQVGARTNGEGQKQLFMRTKPDDPPTSTITDDDIRDPSMTPFDLEETVICNTVTLNTLRYKVWSKSDGGTKPLDKTAALPNVNTDSLPNVTSFGTQQQTYTMEAAILFTNDYILGPQGQPVQSVADPDTTFFTEALAQQIFDYAGQGAVFYEFHCLPTVGADVGDFVIVDVAYVPGANASQGPVTQRGSPRVGMVTKRTWTPAGPDLRILDYGESAAPTVVPTFTLNGNAFQARHGVVAVLTNVPSLTALAGVKVRIQLDFTSTPAGSGVDVALIDPTVQTTWYSPRLDNGTLAVIRMRSEVPGMMPGPWSPWQSVTTQQFVAPSALSFTAQADGDTHLLAFTPGETEYPTMVIVAAAAFDLSARLGLSSGTRSVTGVSSGAPTVVTPQTFQAATFVGVLPAGSTQILMRGLQPGTAYVATVFHQDYGPYNGTSPAATGSFTTASSQATAAAPTHASAWVGEVSEDGAPFVDGTYGLEVTASEWPSTIVLQVAVETSVGSNTPGTYTDTVSDLATIDSASILNRVRLQTFAPNDGLKRYVRAYAYRQGATASAPTTGIAVEPWGTPTGTLPGLITLP